MLSILLFLVSTPVFASEGGLNFYQSLGAMFHVEHHDMERLIVIFSGVLVLLINTCLGLAYSSYLKRQKDPAVPDGKVSIRTIVEPLASIVHSIAKDNCGHHYERYIPLLGGIFFFLLFCNLSGLIPGLPPATENISSNLAMGLMVFVVYNYAGLKEHGISYVKQFMGPMLLIAPIFFVIELVSHFSRPFSLSLRLMGNIFGDHLMLALFTDLTYVIVPSALLFFGLIVAVVQSFVFTLLSGIYISMAISHDH